MKHPMNGVFIRNSVQLCPIPPILLAPLPNPFVLRLNIYHILRWREAGFHYNKLWTTKKLLDLSTNHPPPPAAAPAAAKLVSHPPQGMPAPASSLAAMAARRPIAHSYHSSQIIETHPFPTPWTPATSILPPLHYR
jgi:hypothetical protein